MAFVVQGTWRGGRNPLDGPIALKALSACSGAYSVKPEDPGVPPRSSPFPHPDSRML